MTSTYKRIGFTLLSLITVAGGTVAAIRYAQGYRPTRTGQVRSTGLLNANSFPTGASVYINGNLSSATNATINLTPGDYDVEIRKEGFISWKKKLHLEKELVTQTNALLFPITSSLTPLSYVGVEHIAPSPDGQKIVFANASASASTKKGLYVLDMSDNPLGLNRSPRFIANSTSTWNFEKATILWSPNGDQILVSQGNKNILLEPNKTVDTDTVKDMSISLHETLTTWQEQLDLRMQAELTKFPVEFVKIATVSATNIFVSPDQERVMYTATSQATIPNDLIPAVPAASTQAQSREITPGNTYVYDRKEDRNFLIVKAQVAATPAPTATPVSKKKPAAKSIAVETTTPVVLSDDQIISTMSHAYSGMYTNSPQWLPDSKHIVFSQAGSVIVVEYDGTNQTNVYSGPFVENVIYPWPNGSKIVILTNFNQPISVPYNLYAVGLR